MIKYFILVILLSSSFLQANIRDLIKKGEVNSAINLLNKQKNSFEKFSLLALAFAKKNDFKNAKKFYEKALSIKKDIKVIINYTNLYAKNNNFQKALSILKTVKSENIEYQLTLAKLYAFLNSKERMIDVIKNIKKENLNKIHYVDLIELAKKVKDKNLQAKILEYYINFLLSKNINYKKVRNIRDIINNLRNF